MKKQRGVAFLIIAGLLAMFFGSAIVGYSHVSKEQKAQAQQANATVWTDSSGHPMKTADGETWRAK